MKPVIKLFSDFVGWQTDSSQIFKFFLSKQTQISYAFFLYSTLVKSGINYT